MHTHTQTHTHTNTYTHTTHTHVYYCQNYNNTTLQCHLYPVVKHSDDARQLGGDVDVDVGIPHIQGMQLAYHCHHLLPHCAGVGGCHRDSGVCWLHRPTWCVHCKGRDLISLLFSSHSQKFCIYNVFTFVLFFSIPPKRYSQSILWINNKVWNFEFTTQHRFAN